MPRDVSEERRGAAAWLRRWWRPLLSELLATALLVLLGVAALLPRDAPLTHAALAFGFAVLINVEAFGPVSGAHMNPAVTLGAVLAGALGWRPALAYAAAQALGGVLGFGALLALARGPLPAGAGCTVPALAPVAAAALEAALTAALLLLCCALWAAHDPARPDRAASVKLALGLAGLVYAGGPYTGASLNPARSLGPALLMGHWTHHWVYWVGPLLGAALAALLHRFVLRPRPAAAGPPAPAGPEDVPLNDKV